jgi:hypothetical protein
MRIVRAAIGTLLLLVAMPILVGGAVLWVAMQHRDPDGGFHAHLEPVRTDGYAVVVDDVDALLRHDAAFARGGRTTLQVGAPGRFVGVAAGTDVDRYLTDVGRRSIERVRLARGRLPVDSTEVTGAPFGTALGAPAEQPFWRYSNAGALDRPVTWSPSSTRGQRLAVVVMNPDAAPGVNVELSAAIAPGWLNPTTWGLLILGTVALLLGIMALAWPRARREIVYVVTPAQMPEVAAHLGLTSKVGVGGAPLLAGQDSQDSQDSQDGQNGGQSDDRSAAQPAVRPTRHLTARPPVTVRLTWPQPAAVGVTAPPRTAPDEPRAAPDEPRAAPDEPRAAPDEPRVDEPVGAGISAA